MIAMGIRSGESLRSTSPGGHVEKSASLGGGMPLGGYQAHFPAEHRESAKATLQQVWLLQGMAFVGRCRQ
jgi:hypothetical protein